MKNKFSPGKRYISCSQRNHGTNSICCSSIDQCKFGIGSNLQGDGVTVCAGAGSNNHMFVGLDGFGLVKRFVVVDEGVRVLSRKGDAA